MHAFEPRLAGELYEHISASSAPPGAPCLARREPTPAGGAEDRRQAVLKLAASTAEVDEEQQRSRPGAALRMLGFRKSRSALSGRVPAGLATETPARLGQLAALGTAEVSE